MNRTERIRYEAELKKTHWFQRAVAAQDDPRKEYREQEIGRAIHEAYLIGCSTQRALDDEYKRRAA